MSGNLGPNSSMLCPNKGFDPEKLIWSVITIKSPALKSLLTAPAAFVTISFETPNNFITLTGKVTLSKEYPS